MRISASRAARTGSIAQAASVTEEVSRQPSEAIEGAEATAAAGLRDAAHGLTRHADTLRGKVGGFLGTIRAA